MMSYEKMRRVILNRYHKDINYWWRLLGEMFEGTAGFTKPYKIKCILDGKSCCVGWDDYNWYLD